MALLDKAYKQRMVGALVLVALAVIFLPMLFSRQDEQRPARSQLSACVSGAGEVIARHSLSALHVRQEVQCQHP